MKPSNITLTGNKFRVPANVLSYDDTMVAPTTSRVGTVAPTLATGFRGDANFQMLNFVHTQADEVQFTIQMPHCWKVGTTIYPHVHFCLAGTVADSTYAVQFIMEYYWANINDQFPASPSNLTMTKSGIVVASDDKNWYHYMATNNTGITNVSGEISSILIVRLYRDNTVAANYPAAITYLGFDMHHLIDGFGSDSESSKT